jgi:hypothetical protein
MFDSKNYITILQVVSKLQNNHLLNNLKKLINNSGAKHKEKS